MIIRSFSYVTLAVVWRGLRRYIRNPAISFPYFAMPTLLFAFGGGGLSGLANAPAFDFPSGYTAFYFVYIILQGSAFTGAATGASIASDFETGFARRLLIAAPHRVSVVVGYILASLILATVLMAFLTVVGLLAGMNLEGSLLQIAGLYLLGLLVTMVASLWAAGFALRARVTQAQSAISMPLFLSLMLSPAFVPRPLLSDWLKSIADYNPYTAILEGSRGLISGNPDETGLAYLVVAGLILVFTVWSLTGLRAALQST